MTNEKKYIPINKGHFDLDTPERTAAFQEKLGRGWEADYREYRRLWSELPERQEVRDYPLLVDLEMASVCNLHCPMCPTAGTAYHDHVEGGFLDMDILRKVVDEVAGNIYSLRLSLVGEPTLHKALPEAVAYAKKAGIPEVSFLTNGSRLDLDYFLTLAEAGVDWITVSVDGLDEAYEAIRKPLKFKDTLKKLTDIQAWKDSHGSHKPVIKIQSIWPALRGKVEAFYNTIAPVSDLIAYNPLIDYKHEDQDIVYVEGFMCPQYYERLVIASDGRVKMCSNDEYRSEVVGDAATQSVHEIWHGEALNRLREIHKRPEGFMEIETCRQCYYPRATECEEMAVVNGREFCVENYINRPQSV